MKMPSVYFNLFFSVTTRPIIELKFHMEHLIDETVKTTSAGHMVKMAA